MGSARQIRGFAAYGLTILLTKGFALVTIPLVASHLEPQQYGELDLAVSIAEFVSLFCTLGLAEVLYRFCNGEQGDKRLAELAGLALTAAAIALAATQLAAPLIIQISGLGIDPLVFRLTLAAAATTALVELPLAFLRMRDRPMAFLGLVVARTLVQVGGMWLLLSAGFGPEGVLLANAAVQMLAAATMAVIFLREAGIGFSREMTANLFLYGMPLVASGVFMFALGSADRWFLAGAVTREELAHYAIATKFAMATALLIQPLGLWWYPRRLALLREPGGVERNAMVWLAGLAVLSGGGAIIVLVTPLFVSLALPASYAPALVWLAWLAPVYALNEMVSLSNAGAYLGRSSFGVLGVNAAAAGLVIALYALAVPQWGVIGAIGATLAAQGFRLGVFAWLSRHSAPVPLISWQAAAIVAAGVAPAAMLPAAAPLPLTLAAIMACAAGPAAIVVALRSSHNAAAAGLQHA